MLFTKDLNFASGNFSLTFRTLVITGVCRSGKTTLGNLLATCQRAEHADEPWLPYMLPFLAASGRLDEGVARSMLTSCLGELMRDMILLRQANFRTGDLSSVWKQKDPQDIFERMATLQSRADVNDYIAKHDPLFILNLAEIMPVLDFYVQALPGTKVLHVVRRGADVARLIVQKQWFGDAQLKAPVNAQMYRPKSFKGRTWHLPWWVDTEDEETFLEYDDTARAFYYWTALLEHGLKKMQGPEGEGKLLTVKFEDLADDPKKTFEKAAAFASLQPGPLSAAAVSRFTRSEEKSDGVPQDLPRDLLAKVKSLYVKLGY